ncbi:MAG TPA: LON peptidase substrate-binding domain-containing protein [Roseiflexaceae bacterium]|nr:LON peptidase substrate-binding domain-containing protein [Roseiflexaceae bacterium]
MTQKMPLFPLNTVLFPGAPISLHIFEERYRMMIGRCLEQGSPFGVVLIRSGDEVQADDPWIRRLRALAGAAGEPDPAQGSPAIPHGIGTTARITDSVRLDDGRYYLVAMGQHRFRIQYLIQHQPYLVASVSYLPEESSDALHDAADVLRQAYQHYWSRLQAATGYAHEVERLPEGVVELTYWLAHRLRVDTQRKQHWLEADVATRISEMTAAIEAEVALLPGVRPPGEYGSIWAWN